MDKLYLTPDGRFPALDGVPMLVTQEDFENCCCPAPSACPCGDWPHPIGPEDFPCSGLLYEYAVEASATKDSDPTGDCYTLAPCTVPAFSSDLITTSCDWRATHDVYNCILEINESKTILLNLNTVGTQAWQISWTVGATVIRFLKETGSTPVGTYTLLATGSWVGWSGSATVS
jgi:hypothetical protein